MTLRGRDKEFFSTDHIKRIHARLPNHTSWTMGQDFTEEIDG